MKFILKKNGQIISETELVSGTEYLVGRDKACDFVLDSEIGISRKHFKIYESEEGIWIIESISTHGQGVIVNGEEAEGVEIGDSISLNFRSYLFDFQLPESEQVVEEEPAPTEKTQTKTGFTQTRGVTRIISRKNFSSLLSISMEGASPEYVSLNQGEQWTLGRSEESDICIEHPNISSEHLKINKVENRFYVTDMGSSNGTWINGKPIKANTAQELKSEDVIEISNISITFEIQNEDFKDMIKNLPQLPEQDDDPQVIQGNMPAPKVILEDALDNLQEDGKKPSSNKKFIFYGIMGIVLAVAIYFGTQEKEEKKPVISQEELKKQEERKKARDDLKYARLYASKQQFSSCVDKLAQVPNILEFKEEKNKTLLICQTGLESIEKERLAEERRKQEKETEEAIQKIVKECTEKVDTFQTVEDADICLTEAIKLDPQHVSYSAIHKIVNEKNNIKVLEQQQKEVWRASINSKKVYYTRAKSLDKEAQKSTNPDLDLKTAAAYEKFVSIAKNTKYFKKLVEESQNRAQEIRDNYARQLEELYSKCEALIDANNMKEAYPVCKDILNFQKDNKKAQAWMAQARKTLRNKLKPLYEESVLKESLSRVDQAKKIWQQIISEDIKTGHYYKKARIKLKKYE